MVSVVNIATVLEDCDVEEPAFGCAFVVCKKGSTRRIFLKECFLFAVTSDYGLKRFTFG
jgi:hypothetical protein